eukprot:5283434-Prymnesium_polylepis.1
MPRGRLAAVRGTDGRVGRHAAAKRQIPGHLGLDHVPSPASSDGCTAPALHDTWRTWRTVDSFFFFFFF